MLLYFPLLSSGSFLLDSFSSFDFLILKSISAWDFLVFLSFYKQEIIWFIFFSQLTLSLLNSLSFDFSMLTIGSSVVNRILRSYFLLILWVGLEGSTLPGLEPSEFWVLFIFLMILLQTSGDRVLIISSFIFQFLACFSMTVIRQSTAFHFKLLWISFISFSITVKVLFIG